MEMLENLINERREELEDKRKILSHKINNIKDVALKISTKDGYDANKLVCFLNSPKTLERCVNEVNVIKELSLEDLLGVIKSYNRWIVFNKEKEELNIRLGLPKDIDISFIEESILKSGRKELLIPLKKLKENDLKLKNLGNDAKVMIDYVCYLIMNEYNILKEEKENTASKSKMLKYALSAIKEERMLLPKEKASLIELINEEVDDKNLRKELFDSLNNYIENYELKHKKAKEENKKISKKSISLPVTYVDSKCKEKKTDDTYYNYLVAIKSFNDFNDIKSFLDAICNNINISYVIERMLNYLGDSNYDILLKNYLINYSLNVEKEEHPFKEDGLDSNFILYYDIFDGKNKVLEDIKKFVPNSYYKDVKKAIESLKYKDESVKIEHMRSLKKIYKIRINDIRITCKRLSKNIYIILGVFCKKDHKGYEVVNVTRKRNKDFSLREDILMKNKLSGAMWNGIINLNDEFDKEINERLKSKVK